MPLDFSFSLIIIFFFLISFFYSSVGFGGGSSYLALLSITFISFYFIRTTALLCNLVVVSGSCILYFKEGHLKFKRFLPFVLTSVPLAFFGASFKLEQNTFFLILGVVLIFSAFFLVYQTFPKNTLSDNKVYPVYLSYLIGAGIGFLSGIVGIGGGIFLAPLLNHMKWDKPIVISSLASFFILLNSFSGLVGLSNSGSLVFNWPESIFLIISVLAGGQIGVRTSIKFFSQKTIRYFTAILVFIAGCRIFFNAYF